jgi:hypothetical protein
MALLAKTSQIKSLVYTTSALALLYSTYVYYSKEDEKEKTNIPTPESAYPYIGKIEKKDPKLYQGVDDLCNKKKTGHLLSLGHVPSNQIFKWHEKYGPIIRVKMGIQDWIFVADPILAHKIFSGFGMYTSARPYSTFTTKHYSFGGQ